MLLDSPEAVLSVFGFSRSFYGFKKKKTTIDGMKYTNNVSKILSQQKWSYKISYKIGEYDESISERSNGQVIL